MRHREDVDSGAAKGMKHCVREGRTKTDEGRKVRKQGRREWNRREWTRIPRK